MQAPDLRGYDLEYAELIGVHWEKQLGEIEMRIQSPAAGWYYKRKIVKMAQALGVKKYLPSSCTEYLLTLTFLGVSEVTDTLLSQGHTIGAFGGSNAEWLEAATKLLSFEIDDIRNVRLADDNLRFYLWAEGLKLEFNYQDCIFLQKCIS
jgi:hypothetical protein